MDLGTLREKFAQTSGRYDLVNADGSDNGADFFINAAQRKLDRLVDVTAADARHFEQVSPGTFLLKTQKVRALRRVTAATDDGRAPLRALTMWEMRDLYGEDFSLVDTGQPLYWTLAKMRLSPEEADWTQSNFTDPDSDPETDDAMNDYQDIAYGDDPAVYQGVIIMPAPSVVTTIVLWGKFYSPTLTADTDLSWWTVNAPEVLIMATQGELEWFNRNESGAQAWEKVVRDALICIQHDTIEQEMSLYENQHGGLSLGW